MTRRREWNRRRALLAGLAALGGAAWLPQLVARRRRASVEPVSEPAASAPPARTDPGGRLVVVELYGGEDGLSTVVPTADDAYHRLRPTLGLAPDEVLPIDDERGFARSLANLHALYDTGKVAIVEGAGYPDPIYSHFRSFEVWHTARREGRASGDGWLGRLRMAAFPDDARNELLVHVGTDAAYSVACAERPALAFSEPDGLRWRAEPVAREMYRAAAEAPDRELGKEGGMELAPDPVRVLDLLREGFDTAQQAARRMRRAAEKYRPRADYPHTELAQSLRTVAALLQSNVGTRVFSVQQGTYDLHGETLRTKHARLLTHLDGALHAFLSDIHGTHAGARTLVLVFSEFGRRAAENESRGTDHGAAGPMFVIGPGVHGGLYGARPSLTELDGEGNLAHTVDFRSVYATLIERCFGISHERVLPERYPLLPLLGA